MKKHSRKILNYPNTFSLFVFIKILFFPSDPKILFLNVPTPTANSSLSVQSMLVLEPQEIIKLEAKKIVLFNVPLLLFLYGFIFKILVKLSFGKQYSKLKIKNEKKESCMYRRRNRASLYFI